MNSTCLSHDTTFYKVVCGNILFLIPGQKINIMIKISVILIVICSAECLRR